VANGFEWVNLREVVITAILGSLIAVVLVSQYQLLGAAIALLFTSLSGCSQYMYSVYARLFPLQLWRVIRRPLLISIAMLTVFGILRNVTQDFLMTLIAASFAYTLLVSLIGIYALGGPGVVWAKLLRKEQGS
jgi:O-antigen/teichoic acid export membrane protein